MSFSEIISAVDDFVWGPVMLVLLVGTGVFLTFRLKFRPWRNLGYALKSTLSKEARTTKRGSGDVSPFSALTTALAATIGTGNIVGVATAMVAGGPGALVWMWLSACFGMSSKFSECMLAIKYREVNEKGEMCGGPMYTMKRGFKNKKTGAVLGMFFAVSAVIASFGIGNMTQANSIAESLKSTFYFNEKIVGVVLTILALMIIVGGIKSISKVSSVVVPIMAIFYVFAGFIVIIVNIHNLPSGIVMIFEMAFAPESVAGGVAGTMTISVMNAIRFGVARGVFSNEAGMGSAGTQPGMHRQCSSGGAISLWTSSVPGAFLLQVGFQKAEDIFINLGAVGFVQDFMPAFLIKLEGNLFYAGFFQVFINLPDALGEIPDRVVAAAGNQDGQLLGNALRPFHPADGIQQGEQVAVGRR